MRHYYRYASAAYGYWWWLLDRPGSHCWRLARALHCTPHPRPGLTGDGWLMPNLAAIQAMLVLSSPPRSGHCTVYCVVGSSGRGYSNV